MHWRCYLSGKASQGMRHFCRLVLMADVRQRTHDPASRRLTVTCCAVQMQRHSLSHRPRPRAQPPVMNQALPFSPRPATSTDGQRPQPSAGDAERQRELRASRGAHADVTVAGAGEARQGEGRRGPALRKSRSAEAQSREVPQRTWPQVNAGCAPTPCAYRLSDADATYQSSINPAAAPASDYNPDTARS
jgi:hypothetical protein